MEQTKAASLSKTYIHLTQLRRMERMLKGNPQTCILTLTHDDQVAEIGTGRALAELLLEYVKKQKAYVEKLIREDEY